MAKKYAGKLHFTSLDIVLYSAIIFTAGIMCGLAFGRFKHARFYFAGKRIDLMQQAVRNMTAVNEQVKTNVTTILLPTVDFVKKRAPDYGCRTADGTSNFNRTFASNPDVLTNVGGISLNLRDATTTSKTFWLAKAESEVTPAAVKLSGIQPNNTGIRTCWIAVPDASVP